MGINPTEIAETKKFSTADTELIDKAFEISEMKE